MSHVSTTLITAFQPFQARTANGSATVLRWLRHHWPTGQYHSRILPVVWATAPSMFDKLLAKHRPHRCLSLGEGHPGQLAWETMAQNQQQGTDELQQPPAQEIIDSTASPTLPSTWPAPAEPSQLPPGITFIQSSNAGRYLCNRILWQALHSPHRPAQAAFLHLPPQDNTPDRVYAAAYAPIVLALLLAQPVHINQGVGAACSD